MVSWALDGVAQLVGTSSCKLKAHRFNYQSGHMPALWVWSQLGDVLEATDRCLSHSHVSLSQPCFPLSLSNPLSSPISKINKLVLKWGLKEKRWSADFTTKFFLAKRDWNKIFKVMNSKYLQPRLLYPTRLQIQSKERQTASQTRNSKSWSPLNQYCKILKGLF